MWWSLKTWQQWHLGPSTIKVIPSFRSRPMGGLQLSTASRIQSSEKAVASGMSPIWQLIPKPFKQCTLCLCVCAWVKSLNARSFPCGVQRGLRRLNYRVRRGRDVKVVVELTKSNTEFYQQHAIELVRYWIHCEDTWPRRTRHTVEMNRREPEIVFLHAQDLIWLIVIEDLVKDLKLWVIALIRDSEEMIGLTDSPKPESWLHQ